MGASWSNAFIDSHAKTGGSHPWILNLYLTHSDYSCHESPHEISLNDHFGSITSPFERQNQPSVCRTTALYTIMHPLYSCVHGNQLENNIFLPTLQYSDGCFIDRWSTSFHLQMNHLISRSWDTLHFHWYSRYVWSGDFWVDSWHK